ncbi:MAG: hypothetical protein OEW15_15095 [Nitrospirota bacterium]|nr:hypothetical protein [Nitrospirota bacterium]
MTCPFAAGKYMLSCDASRISYVPSDEESSEYCTDGKHERYRLCANYRYAVWNGLTPVPLPEPRQRPDSGCQRKREIL